MRTIMMGLVLAATMGGCAKVSGGWDTSEGDCTKSADCPQGEYCKAGTCVPKDGPK